MSAYDWFLVCWYADWAVILVSGIVYAVAEARRHRRARKRHSGRVPLTCRWWLLTVGED